MATQAFRGVGSDPENRSPSSPDARKAFEGLSVVDRTVTPGA